MQLIPAAFALLAAALFGLNVHIHRKALETESALAGAMISVATMAGMFWLMAPFLIETQWFWTRGAVIFALVGLFFPALGQRLQIASVAKVGPALTSAIGAFTPLFAVLPAILFLGEAFRLQAAVGIASMMAGLLLAAIGRRGISRNWPLWALLIPLTAAFVRGVAQPLTKAGYADLPSPFFAALLMSSVSSLVLLAMLSLSNQPKIKPAGRQGSWLFALSGIINGCGIFALNSAISLGDVLVAAPLASSAPLWALGFGAVFFRSEVLGIRHLAVALLVVLGAVLIILH